MQLVFSSFPAKVVITIDYIILQFPLNAHPVRKEGRGYSSGGRQVECRIFTVCCFQIESISAMSATEHSRQHRTRSITTMRFTSEFSPFSVPTVASLSADNLI